jgi:hypothetical protein
MPPGSHGVGERSDHPTCWAALWSGGGMGSSTILGVRTYATCITHVIPKNVPTFHG